MTSPILTPAEPPTRAQMREVSITGRPQRGQVVLDPIRVFDGERWWRVPEDRSAISIGMRFAKDPKATFEDVC